MAAYRFEEIAIVGKDKKKPTDADKTTYIGLEHLSSDTFEVEEYGSEVAPKGEKLVMRKGDVLFGKRRAYQKKVGIAPCDGIFSAHGMVLRPNEDVVNARFFPFFIRSDVFLDEAIRISVGSLSPTVNWRDLKELVFELPSLDKQRELAELLWAAEETKWKYRELIKTSDDIVKSRFVEMFGDYNAAPSGFLRDVSEFVTVGIANAATHAYTEAGVVMLRNLNVRENCLDDSDLVYIKPEFAAKYCKKALKTNDILVTRTGYPGIACLVPEKYEGCQTFTTLIVRLRKDAPVTPTYVCQFINSPLGKEFVEKMKAGSSQQNFGATSLKQMPIGTPPLAQQQEFATFVAQVNKSKVALQQSLDDLNATMIAILNEELGTRDV